MIIETTETLTLRMLDAFWCLRNNSMVITSPDRIVRLELERLVTGDEVAELTTWILKQNIKAEQLDD